MSTTLTLDKRHFQAAVQKARELGKTPWTYIQSLIDAATLTLDEILSPVRKGFAASGVTEDPLDEAVAQARKTIQHKTSKPTQTFSSAHCPHCQLSTVHCPLLASHRLCQNPLKRLAISQVRKQFNPAP